MMALTVMQPWAWAIANGVKVIENRTWSIGYRGPLAIHAGQAWDETGESTFLRCMAEIGVLPPEWYREPLPRGVVVAVAHLADICAESSGGRLCGCGVWAVPGRYHWRLDNVRALAEPVPARGRLGLWNIELPGDPA